MKLNLLIVFLTIILITVNCNARENIPSHIDLSKSEYFPTLGHQGNLGSCDWFAAIYYQMTYLYNKQLKRIASPSNIFSPQFGYNFLNNGDIYPYNIRLSDVYHFVEKHGSATIQQYPYNSKYRTWCTDPLIWKEALNYRTKGFECFTFQNGMHQADYNFNIEEEFLYEIKRILAEEEILVIQTLPSTSGIINYGKISNNPSSTIDDNFIGEYIITQGKNGPDHTMAVVGYNDDIWVDLNNDNLVQEIELGAIKIADSYGQTNHFRNSGFIWMLYSTITSSIFENRVNRMLIIDNYSPKVIARITMNSSRRDHIQFQFTCSIINTNGSSSEKLTFDPFPLGFENGEANISLIKGANCAYNGADDFVDGSFVFDLSDIYLDINNSIWSLKLKNSDSIPLIIKNFEIIYLDTGDTITDTNLPISVVNDEIIREIKTENISSSKKPLIE